jgi:hypothetical protein
LEKFERREKYNKDKRKKWGENLRKRKKDGR